MGIHHLNCGTLRPASARLVNGRGGLLERARLACNCLLVEHAAGEYTLIDTGLGTLDLADPVGRLGQEFVRRCGPALDPAEPAVAQVAALGIDPRRVTSIVLTHHDLDHAGGLADFPWAEVHLSSAHLSLIAPALDARLAGRLRPQQWRHGPLWRPAQLRGRGLGRPSAQVNDRIHLVALDGHIEGHCGVMITRPGLGPLLHVGDAVYDTRVLRGGRTPLGLAVFERLMRTDRRAWRESRAWLYRQVAEGVDVLCAHERDVSFSH
ncbi:MBL fold metallo-hydrolase [Actinomyces slackii]|nr:MBL fold metallo-hydrolase [Actinomyces slackii]